MLPGRKSLGTSWTTLPDMKLPDIDLGKTANDFRNEFRAWLAENWDGHLSKETEGLPVNHRRADRAFSRKLAEKNWLALRWPKQFGGLERSALEHLVFEEELAYAEAPVTWHNTSVNMIAPALIAHGSPAQCARFLPAIASGDLCFALGYSEPDNGSDLAGLKTRARPVTGGWIINGQKTFTSHAGFANLIWLAARSGETEARQAGISVFIVPTDADGITIHPMMGLNDHRANNVFFDDVFVSDDALVGAAGGGWTIITAALAFERVSLAGIAARARAYFDRLTAELAHTRRNGKPMASDSLVRDTIGGLAAEIEGARLLAIQTALAIEDGRVPVHEAAMAKVYASEFMERLSETAFDLLGAGAALRSGSSSALVDGRFEYSVRDALLFTIGGGTNEIQRSLIATKGLGLPR